MPHQNHERLRWACFSSMPHTFPNHGMPHLLWGGQSCPQPPFRRPFRAARESSGPRSPAESRLQPGLGAPRFPLPYRREDDKAVERRRHVLDSRPHAVAMLAWRVRRAFINRVSLDYNHYTMLKFTLCLVLAASAFGQKRPITLDSMSQGGRGGGGGRGAAAPTWAPDGKTFVFRQGRSLAIYDPATRRSKDLVAVEAM